MLHGAPTGAIQKLQREQNNAARIVLQASRQSHTKPLLHQLHWLPVQQRITYTLAVLMYKVRSTSTPVYLRRRIAERACSRTLRTSAIQLLDQPFMKTDVCRRAFRYSAPSVWNSLPQAVLISDSLTVFRSRLKTVPDLKLLCSIRLYRTWIRPADRASEVTTVWRYRNWIIIFGPSAQSL